MEVKEETIPMPASDSNYAFWVSEQNNNPTIPAEPAMPVEPKDISAQEPTPSSASSQAYNR